MQKKITTRFWVSLKGEYVLLDSLPEEKQKQILTELNDRSMHAIGLVRDDEVKETTA